MRGGGGRAGGRSSRESERLDGLGCADAGRLCVFYVVHGLWSAESAWTARSLVKYKAMHVRASWQRIFAHLCRNQIDAVWSSGSEKATDPCAGQRRWAEIID